MFHEGAGMYRCSCCCHSYRPHKLGRGERHNTVLHLLHRKRQVLASPRVTRRLYADVCHTSKIWQIRAWACVSTHHGRITRSLADKKWPAPFLPSKTLTFDQFPPDLLLLEAPTEFSASNTKDPERPTVAATAEQDGRIHENPLRKEG